MSLTERKDLIVAAYPDLPITEQAECLNIPRSSIYYKPIKKDEQDIMDAIDEIYTESPFYGARKIKKELERRRNWYICKRRVSRLMRTMGLEAIYPKPKTSAPNKQHKKYPYLLKGLTIGHPHQVWGTDITYIRLLEGFLYLVAILDWYSRYVISWRLSPTLESQFCREALEEALLEARAEIHNSDQGVQFTSDEYTEVLKAHKVKISMDGRGRCMDNIFTERLWRTVKYEDVYIKEYASPQEAQAGLRNYFEFYNHRRIHEGIGYQTPAELYFS
jgi:putative transposase